MPELRIPNGFTPRGFQADAMRYYDSGGTRGVYCWPRRAGKDLTFVHQAVKAALQRPGLYLHTLPTAVQARRVVWDNIDNDGRHTLNTAVPNEIRKGTNNTEMKIELKNGSIIQLIGGDNYDSAVGTNPVGITMSEAALTNPAAWNYFRPMLAANGGWAAFISTPRGYNWFYDLLQTAKADPFWDWSHLTVNDTCHIPQIVLEQERREMIDELYRQEYLCDFSAANVGAIFGRWMEAAEREGRIVPALRPDPLATIFVSSDIGYRDKAAFWWWRVLRGGFELIDYDEGSGLDAEEWIDRLQAKPRANMMLLPHDAKVKTFQSRHSVIEQFLRANIADEVRVNPQRKKADSIAAGRKVLPVCRFDASLCHDGIEALRSYHFEYDEKQRIFSKEPDHDWSSHAADAFMEGASVLSDFMPKLAPPPKPLLVPQVDKAFTLDMIWDTAPGHGTRRVG